MWVWFRFKLQFLLMKRVSASLPGMFLVVLLFPKQVYGLALHNLLSPTSFICPIKFGVLSLQSEDALAHMMSSLIPFFICIMVVAIRSLNKNTT